MIKRITPLLVGLVVACGGNQTPPDENIVPSPTPDPVVEPAEPGVTSLNTNTTAFDVDGIHVIHKQTEGNAIVDVRVFIDGGAHYWTADTAGAERLSIGIATSGGPASMEKNDYTAAVEAMGSSISGSSDYDYATLSMSTIVPYFDETWALFAETITNPAFRASDIELRTEQTLVSIRTEMDDPGSGLGTLAKEVAFAGHPYEVRPQGTEETIAALTPEDLRAAYDALLVKSRMTVVVVGNVSREAVESLVTGAFGQLPADLPDGFVSPAAGSFDYPEGNVTLYERELPTNYILGYFAAPPVAHEDYPALQAALAILADRLFEEVRTRRNLSYAVSSGISDRRNVTGYLYVTAEEANTTIQVMYDTVDGMIEPGVAEQDLQDQIEGYLTGYYRGLQSNGAQASMLGRWEIIGGGRENADVHVERLGAVTAEDISRVLETYVRDIQFAIVGDPAAVDTTIFAGR